MHEETFTYLAEHSSKDGLYRCATATLQRSANRTTWCTEDKPTPYGHHFVMDDHGFLVNVKV